MTTTSRVAADAESAISAASADRSFLQPPPGLQAGAVTGGGGPRRQPYDCFGVLARPGRDFCYGDERLARVGSTRFYFGP